jgi:hypothetical protein
MGSYHFKINNEEMRKDPKRTVVNSIMHIFQIDFLY